MIGIVSALALIALEWLGDLLKDGLWSALPDAVGVDPDSPLYIFLMLSAIGVLIGLVVWLAPGHAGPDPATTGLIEEPLPLGALPALAIVTIIAQGGGVSLGPEAPIVVLNVSLVVAAIKIFKLPIPIQLGIVLATAATIGALFGTPVAAALILTGMVAMAKGAGSLWDRLFLPLVAAAVAAVTMTLISETQLQRRPARRWALPAGSTSWRRSSSRRSPSAWGSPASGCSRCFTAPSTRCGIRCS